MLKPFETHLIQIGSFLPIFAGLKLPPTVACGSEVSWEAEIGEPNSLNLRRFGLPSCTAKSNAWGCTFVVPLESGITWCTTLTTRRGRKILSLSCVCFIHSDVVWFTSEKQKCLTWCICIYIYISTYIHINTVYNLMASLPDQQKNYKSTIVGSQRFLRCHFTEVEIPLKHSNNSVVQACIWSKYFKVSYATN